MKAEMLFGKLLLLSYIYAPVFGKFVSVQLSLLLSSFNPLLDAFFRIYRDDYKKKTALFCIKYQEHCRQNGIVQKQLPCPIVSF